MIRCLGAALLLCLLSTPVAAIELIRIDLGSMEGGAWTLRGGALVLELRGETPALKLEVSRFRGGGVSVEGIVLRCREMQWLPERVACARGRLDLGAGELRASAATVAFSWWFASRRLDLQVQGLVLAGGRLDLDFSGGGTGWRARLDIAQADAAGLAALGRRAGLKLPVEAVQGRVDATFSLAGVSAVDTAEWRLSGQALAWDSADGSQAAEGMGLFSRGRARRHAGEWRVETLLEAREGVLYSDPLYLEFSPARNLALEAALVWRGARRELWVKSLRFEQAGQVRGELSARIAPGRERALRDIRLRLDEARLPAFYDTWVQPWLAGSLPGRLETSGVVRASLAMAGATLQRLYVRADGVDLRDRDGIFGIRQLNGELAWGGPERRSTLAWQGANVYRLAFGPARVSLHSDGRQLELAEPMVVDLLDGRLHVERFELGQDDDGFQWLLDGMLTPVSMQAFSRALGWVPLSGKLSGMIPRMRYAHGELTLGGVLLVQAFDGDITVRNLRVQHPFGLVPRLWADVRIDNLDLDTLTRAFDFGRIEGRLDGAVDGLYMEAWQMVAFDAWLMTPRDDRSRHRISQRAVDNISNLGGGGLGGAVSRGMLRFFEDFPYRRLGIRCRLENGVCRMGGVADLRSGSGYYLVQGRWLPPRLDVIGYAREVDWNSLLERLRATRVP